MKNLMSPSALTLYAKWDTVMPTKNDFNTSDREPFSFSLRSFHFPFWPTLEPQSGIRDANAANRASLFPNQEDEYNPVELSYAVNAFELLPFFFLDRTVRGTILSKLCSVSLANPRLGF